MADDLLQMFQSITTSDHDELIDQFAHLLQLDVQTATFFLESCNWNVETAVNNYLVTVEAAGGGHNVDARDASEDLSMEDESERAPRLSRKTNQLHMESILYQAQCISDLSALQNTLLAPETPVQMVSKGTSTVVDGGTLFLFLFLFLFGGDDFVLKSTFLWIALLVLVVALEFCEYGT